MTGKNSRKRNRGMEYQTAVQFMHLYSNEVTEKTKPSMHSLHTRSFLFSGAHMHSLRSARLIGSRVYPDTVTLYLPDSNNVCMHEALDSECPSNVAHLLNNNDGPFSEQSIIMFYSTTIFQNNAI